MGKKKRKEGKREPTVYVHTHTHTHTQTHTFMDNGMKRKNSLEKSELQLKTMMGERGGGLGGVVERLSKELAQGKFMAKETTINDVIKYKYSE